MRLKIKLEKEKKEERTYKVGQIFEIFLPTSSQPIAGGYYILCLMDVANKLNFISLENGRRWSNSIKVKDSHCITSEELKSVDFKLIADGIDIE